MKLSLKEFRYQHDALIKRYGNRLSSTAILFGDKFYQHEICMRISEETRRFVNNVRTCTSFDCFNCHIVFTWLGYLGR